MTSHSTLQWIGVTGAALCLLPLSSWAASPHDCTSSDPQSSALEAVGSTAREYSNCVMVSEPDKCRAELERLTRAQASLQNSLRDSYPDCPRGAEPHPMPDGDSASKAGPNVRMALQPLAAPARMMPLRSCLGKQRALPTSGRVKRSASRDQSVTSEAKLRAETSSATRLVSAPYRRSRIQSSCGLMPDVTVKDRRDPDNAMTVAPFELSHQTSARRYSVELSHSHLEIVSITASSRYLFSISS